MSLETNIKRLVVFFVITIVISWAMWIPSVLNSNGTEMPGILLIVSMLASFTPSVVGIVMRFKDMGNEKAMEWIDDKINIRFNPIWIAVVIILFPALAGISYNLAHAVNEGIKSEMIVSPIMIPVLFLQILFIGGAIGEEFGWRGYALDKLLSLSTPVVATLILGIIWSLWHLPLFFMEGTVQSNIPIWQFILQNTVVAFFYTWIYLRTKGNMLLMILLHAVANTSAAVFSYWETEFGRYIGFGVLIIAVGIIIVNDGLKMPEEGIFPEKEKSIEATEDIEVTED